MDRQSDTDLFTSQSIFMGVPYGPHGPGNRAAILGPQFDCGTNMRIDSRGGPDAVRQMSPLMCRFNPARADFDPVSALGRVDCCDVRLTPGKILDAYARIEQAVTRIAEASAIPITIGGDGSVTVPVARALGRRHGKMAALHIDSRTDCYPYDPADMYNSATQFTHVAEEGRVDASRSWHVGCTASPTRRAWCRAPSRWQPRLILQGCGVSAAGNSLAAPGPLPEAAGCRSRSRRGTSPRSPGRSPRSAPRAMLPPRRRAA